MLTNYWTFQNRSVQTFGFVYHDTNGQNHGPVCNIQSFLLSKICTVILWQDYHGKGNLRNLVETWLAENSRLGMFLCSSWKRIVLICVCGWHKTGWKTNIFLGSCKVNIFCTWYWRTFTIHKGYGKLRTSLRTISTTLSTLRLIAWAPWLIRTWQLRTTEHDARRLDVLSNMRSYVTLWLKFRLCVFISIHGHRHALLFSSVLFFFVYLYFVLQSFFHTFLNFAMVVDENSMEDPLCNSSLGSMVSLDYDTPDTGHELKDMELADTN